MKNKTIMIIGGTGALGKSLTKRWIFDNDILIFSNALENDLIVISSEMYLLEVFFRR